MVQTKLWGENQLFYTFSATCSSYHHMSRSNDTPNGMAAPQEDPGK